MSLAGALTLSAAEQNATELREHLVHLEGFIGAAEFPAEARRVQALFNSLRPLHKEDRAELWNQYQEAWEQHKETWGRRREESSLARWELEQAMYADLSPDGTMWGMAITRVDWEGMGTKLANARATLDDVEARIRSDNRLLPRDRHELFQKLHHQRQQIRTARDSAWDALYDRAADLYNEAYTAVDTQSPREALEVFKQNQALLRSLYLRPSDREKLVGWFQDLWARLQAEFENRRRQREERREARRARQEEGLGRLLAAKDKLEDFIERVERNLEANRERLSSAWSDGFIDRVSEWIAEDERKLEEARHSLSDLDRKISDAESRLRSL